MQFLYPTFLWALGALIIPIVIHLFYFRRFKKVYFTNVKLLKEVKEETSSRNKLKNLLVLLMRLLVLTFLVLAFAQPFIPVKNDVKKGLASVSVFVDNSFSMSALSQEVPLIELAKEKAREVINAYSIEDRIQILTHDFEGRHLRMYSKEEALSLIDEIEISPSVRNVSNILGRQKQTLVSEGEESKTIYLISDFQKSISDFDNINDTIYDINLIPLQSVQEKNIAIDSCWFEAPVAMLNQTNKLIIKITNYSEDIAENVRLSLNYEGQNKPLGSFDIRAQASIYDTANITVLEPGWQTAELSITDYPVQFDDKFKFSFDVDENIKILSINESGENKYLNAAFLGLNYFNIENQLSQNVNYARLAEFDLIVLNDLTLMSSGLSSELNQYIQNGGNVLMFPGLNSNTGSLNEFLNLLQSNNLNTQIPGQKQVAYINNEEFIFNDVFESQIRNIKLPVTQQNYNITSFESRTEEPILRYRDGTTYLGKYQRGRGHFYLCSSPLQEDVNNLVRNAEIFVPMLYKMAVSTGVRKNISYIIGKDYNIETDNILDEGDLVYKIQGPEEFIPSQYKAGRITLLNVSEQIEQDGFYNLVLNDENLSVLSFNYDRKESDLSYYSLSELKNITASPNFTVFDNIVTADFTNIIGDSAKGVVLWRWCIIFALIFLGLEIMLLRLWKTN